MSEQQTTLDLNGPILSFTTQPVGAASTGVVVGSTGGGTASFVGIATVTFTTVDGTPTNPATNTGSINYRWYEEGVGALSDSTYVTGTATTTLTLSNLITPTDNQRKFYVEADYVPSAYQSSSPVTAGTARSTGNAVNEPFNSNTATVTVFPVITITSQPGIATVTEGFPTNFSVDAVLSDERFNNNELSYQWQLNQQNLSDNALVQGSSEETLTITPSTVEISTVRVTVSHPNAPSVISNNANLNVKSILERKIVNFEYISPLVNSSGVTRSTAQLGQVNLFDFEFTFSRQTNINSFPMEIELISFYSPETDIIVEIDLYGGKGAGGFGGRGGFSRIILSMIKNTEYVIVGLGHYSTINTPFIYKKAKLIACVGSGGDAGTSSASGISAGGSGGGAIPTDEIISSNGIFGSATNLKAIPPDTKATAPDGGRVLSCTRGVYWRQEVESPCSDVGTTQFRLSDADGTIVTNTASIARGFKAGYGINETSGQGLFGGGNGGSGAIGGRGGTSGSGGAGAGGKGYTDGSVTVISSEPGGSIESNAKVVMRFPAGPEIIQSGLVLALDAGNSKSYPGSGTTWADLSGNGNNGTLKNGPTYSSANGGSLVFDGENNDGVQLLGTNLSLNQMTISSWNYSSNYAQNGFMFEKTTNSLVNTQYSLFYNGNNLIYYRTYGLSLTDLTVNTSTAEVVNNQWNNVVATWDGTNKRIYVNGILRATSANLTGTVTQNTTGAAYIGIYGNFAGYPFNGRISKTSIYNRALTLEEIQQNFNALKSRFSIN